MMIKCHKKRPALLESRQTIQDEIKNQIKRNEQVSEVHINLSRIATNARSHKSSSRFSQMNAAVDEVKRRCKLLKDLPPLD